jgi:hypothetical protein
VRGIRLGNPASIALNNRERRWHNDTIDLPVPDGDTWREHSIHISDIGALAGCFLVGFEADLIQIPPLHAGVGSDGGCFVQMESPQCI